MEKIMKKTVVECIKLKYNSLFNIRLLYNVSLEDQDEYFKYWNKEFWKVISTMVRCGSKKIGLIRKVSRDCSMCLVVVHLQKLEDLIQCIFKN